MYERFYNLRERPFTLSPDPDYLYASRGHAEALGYLRYGIQGHAGFVVITGEIGCGKTTLIQKMLRGLDRQTSVARIVNTMLDARELLEAVMLDFGLRAEPGDSRPRLLRELAHFLVEERRAGRLPLLVIDEAQNLSAPALEEIRMLSNLETEKSKLIQIVLVGQPNLRDVLARAELEQLRQRVTVSYHLGRLSVEETHGYLNHRLTRAAIGTPLQFPRDVSDLVHQHSHGVARTINVIADAMLLYGYGEERREIDLTLAQAVIDELQATGVLGRPAIAKADEGWSHVAEPARLDAAIALREARMAERERRLDEQHKLLMEGYQLLRAQNQAAGAPAAVAEQAPDLAPASEPGPAAPAPDEAPIAASVAAAAEPPATAQAATPEPARVNRLESPARRDTLWRNATPTYHVFREAAPRPGMWTRMKRGLFGLQEA